MVHISAILLLNLLLVTVHSVHYKEVRFPKNVVSKGGSTMRIFGGTAADDGQFPYMVFVLFDTGVHIVSCSASLVAPNKVLLAAHCFDDQKSPKPSNVLAVAGKSDLAKYMAKRHELHFSKGVDERALGLQERRGVNIAISPKFGGLANLRHDVALITVDPPFQLDKNVQVIPVTNSSVSQRVTCTIQGWGLAEENRRSYRLMFVNNAHALPVEECSYKSKGPFFCLQQTHSGICQGDSGSPAVCGGAVVGVASHVLTERTDAECGDDLEEFYAALGPEKELLSQLSGPPSPSPASPLQPSDNDGSGGAAMNTTAVLVLCVCLIKLLILS